MEAIDKVVKPLIESAAEEAGPILGGLSKVLGAAVGVVVELATAPATARDEDKLKDVQKKKDDNEHTKEPSPSKWDKHTKPHPSRTGDKLRDRRDWQPKKKKGGPRSPGSKRDKTDDD